MCSFTCLLRYFCMFLGIFFLGAIVYECVSLHNLNTKEIVWFTVELVIGLALFFGALLENDCLVLVALVVFLVEIIFFAICNLDVKLDLDDICAKEIVMDGKVEIFVPILVVFLLIACVIYWYYNEL